MTQKECMKKLQKQLKEANHQLQAYKGGHRGKKKVGGRRTWSG
jgi:hypothetical protein